MRLRGRRGMGEVQRVAQGRGWAGEGAAACPSVRQPPIKAGQLATADLRSLQLQMRCRALQLNH